MRITNLKIENFKRFTDLSIEQIPESAKLVLLIGSNGSGKSSVFDAFDWLKKNVYHFSVGPGKKDYYQKKAEIDPSVKVILSDGVTIHKKDFAKEIDNYRFIGRSSNRIVPHITNQYNPEEIVKDTDAPKSYIENDTRFTNDVYSYIQQINNALREPVFSGRSADTYQIFQDFIAPLNTSLLTILGEEGRTTIQIAEFEDAGPQKNAKLIFKKGESKINYDLLSHGEKQIVILLLNFIVRRKYYEDAIIFIDEMDCHLNTSIQYRLLEEIVTKWIPDSAQLWTASHALGFIDYANKSEQAAIIDFDLLDFDLPQVLFPQPKSSLEVYEIAIPKVVLFELMKDRKLVVCENQNDEYYNLLLLPDTIFVGVKDARDVFLHIKRDARYHSVRDRDFLSDEEIKRIREEYPNHHILEYYDFENYLYHPDNIAEIAPEGFSIEKYIEEISAQKKLKLNRKILPALMASRLTYEEFKTNPKFKDKEVETIVADLESDDLERFYKYFDMKEQFDKSILAPFNLKKEDLVRTNWFKQQIQQIINP
ncbi:AAA family ATPase [Runella slithyformis]|uniref:SMC domain protein n=1 Tax=Runella slithyformis (strain ATCC 29530 / DSM 19594 / LMG 11500 / NCIMB 11436 / LSU 4) TaxID=761193 RepID=A0A7U3ZPB7_RUNSL|nr:AAA family ATPase [Runella slithyformis]AEI50828.1 SMC domain protein [Runella slithyformis DSM 19594]